MRAISASATRRTLPSFIERVGDDHEAVEIISRRGDAALIPTDEYAAWQGTAHMFRSQANARRLLDAYDRAARAGTRRSEP